MTWIKASPPQPDSVARLHQARSGLPVAYLEFLERTGGGEGDLEVEPGWIVFWPAEEVADLNRKYEVEQHLPDFFGFGSSGGGELFAFDMRGEGEPLVVMVPFIPMDPSEAQVVAASFEELERQLRQTADADEVT